MEQIDAVHREIQSALKAAAEKDPDSKEAACVDGFRVFADKLKAYTVYVAGFEAASEELHRWELEEPDVVLFLEERKSKSQESLTLAALLIQPVQRLCRYPLLFAEVLKNTPVTHVEYAPTKEAHEVLENVTQWINAEKRREFNTQRMQQLESQLVGAEFELLIPGRSVVLEGMYRVAEIASFEAVPFAKVIVFNDSLVWARPAKNKTDVFKYEGRILFDRFTKTERIGLDVVRVESREAMRLLQAKDPLATEHLHTVLNEAVTARAQLLTSVHKKRSEAAKNERDRLVAKVETLEKELDASRRHSEVQTKRIALLTQMMIEMCAAAKREVPAELQLPAGPPSPNGNLGAAEETRSPNVGRHQLSAMSRMSKLSNSPKLNAEITPFVVVANEDYLSEDPEELSFAFGELLLLTHDCGDYFLGRPLEGEVFTEKKVAPSKVAQTVKRGNAFVRSSDAVVVSDKVNRDKRSGNFLLDVARATLTRSDAGSKYVKAARSSQDITGGTSQTASPHFRKKGNTGSRTMGSPTTTSDGVVELAPGVLDHSQEVLVKQGWLRMMGGVRKHWKRRYVFLSETNLYYYENDKIAGKKPLGMVAVSEMGSLERLKKFDDGFQLAFGDQLWELRGETAEEASEWMAAIEEGIAKDKSKGPLTPMLRTASIFTRRRVNSDAAMRQPQISAPISTSQESVSLRKNTEPVRPLSMNVASPYASFLAPVATVSAPAGLPLVTSPPAMVKAPPVAVEEAFDSDVYDL